jgi:serine/threonine-protein kinase
MSPEQHSLARQIFEDALQRAEDQRSAYLQTACQGDREVAQEVSRLLDARSQASSFLSTDTHPSLRFGRYVVSRELGRGGMGIVYEAIDPQIGRHLAIKIINFQAITTVEESAVLRERLFREARSAGALSHPGIVVIYDVGEDDQMAYIAMELVDGPSLHQMLASGERLKPAEVLDILRQAAAALDHAHKCGIVHRDIKPANIMLHQKSQVKIADFGIAKITFEPKYTMTGTSMGTPDYMSPEQIEAQATDGRSDQFSLAVVAYELLTGATPFQGGSFAAVLHRIVAGPRPAASAANPALPAGVDEVLRRAMAQLPAERFATCAEFVQALEVAMRPATAATLPMQPVLPVQPAVPVQAAVPVQRVQPAQAAVPIPPRSDKRLIFILAGVLLLAAVLAGAAYRLQLFPISPGAPQSQGVPAAGTSQPSTRVPAPPPDLSPPSPPAVSPVPAEAPPPVTHPAAKTKPAAGEPAASSAQPLPRPVDAPAPRAGLPPPQPVDAARQLLSAAEAGNPEAMDKLGQMYEHGSGGLPRDATEAFRWYNKGAVAGQASALYHLGTLYEAGVATARNLNEATRLYQKAAAAGSTEARARLSQLPAAAARPAPKTASVAPIPRGAIAIQVPANVPWTDTGINLRAGDSVAVTASGLVAVETGGRIPPKAPGGFAPDCRAAAAIYGGRFGVFPAPQLPCWSLIGRVGPNGAIFEVGVGRTFQAQSDGRLLLGINDDTLANNSGYWTAAVTVQRGR